MSGALPVGAVLAVIAAIAVGTFLLRLSFVHWWSDREVPPVVQRRLRLVPAAVLCALVLPAVAFPDSGGGTAGTARLVAGGVAALVAIRTRNVALTIGVGMLALWVLQRFVS